MFPNLSDQVVLVTGGTRGVGLATGLAFARAQATVYLTYRWGSVPEEEVKAQFSSEGLSEPFLIEADVSAPDDTFVLMQEILQRSGKLDVVVSNVAFSKLINDLNDMKRESLELSLRYSSWPLVDLVQTAHTVFEKYPKYVMAISSDGGQICHPNYDFAGAAKSVLETLCRYLALRLKPYGVRVNAIRPGFLETDSSRATFGNEFISECQEMLPDFFLDPEIIGNVCVALASGLLDGMLGQVLVVDEGWSIVSPVSFIKRAKA